MGRGLRTMSRSLPGTGAEGCWARAPVARRSAMAPPLAIKKPRRVVVMGTPCARQYYTPHLPFHPAARVRRITERDGRTHIRPRRGGIRAPAVRGGVPAARQPGRRGGRRPEGLAESLRGAGILCAAVGGVHVALSRAHERLYRRAGPAPTPAARAAPPRATGLSGGGPRPDARAGDRAPRGARAAGAPLRERSRLPGARNDQRNFGQHGQEPARTGQGNPEASAGGLKTWIVSTSCSKSSSLLKLRAISRRGFWAVSAPDGWSSRRWPTGSGSRPPSVVWRGFARDAATTARPPALAPTLSAHGRSCARTWPDAGRSSRGRWTSRAWPTSRPACWPRPCAFRSARSTRTRPSRDAWAIRAPRAPSATRSAPIRCR